MKFKFSLESVLKVRKQQEKLQEQKLAEKLSNKKQIDENHTLMKVKLINYLQSTENEEFKNVHHIRRHSKHMLQVHEKVEQLKGQLKEAENEVRDQRQELAEVHKKRDVMEKVKEIEQKKFAVKLARHEQKIMDEIATQSYSR